MKICILHNQTHNNKHNNEHNNTNRQTESGYPYIHMFQRVARIHKSHFVKTSGVVRDMLGVRPFHTENSRQHADVYTTIPKGPSMGRIHEGSSMPFSGAALDKEETILKASIGFTRILTLNNPRNFNRFDVDITGKFMHQMKIMNTAPFIKAILLKGSGAEAFSFGHNMRTVRRELLENNNRRYVSLQFREVSKLAYYIATCETPIITILNGSVFGAGAGVGCVSDFVIANPGTKYATPEVSYGYIPDAGNTFLLKKVDNKFPGVGVFLGLTGAQIKGFDLIQCNLATHIGMPGVASPILETFSNNHETSQTRTKLHNAVMDSVENDANVRSEPLSFGNDLASIKQCFHNKQSVEEIITELSTLANSTPKGSNVVSIEWAKRTLDAMNKLSPLALKVTHRALYRAIAEDWALHTCHNMEFRAGQHLVNEEDFRVGLEAMVSGNAMPEVWPSKSLDNVTDAAVDRFFDEPLTLAKHGTCDLELPNEVFMEDQLKRRIAKYEASKSAKHRQ